MHPRHSRVGGSGDPSGKTPGQALASKIFHFPEFRICGIEAPSRPFQRGASRSSRDAGRGAVDAAAPARMRDDRAGNRESSGDAIRHGAVIAVLSRPEGEHTQAFGDFDGAVRGRRSRVVLTPGVLASRLAVMRRPDRARASAIRKATGAIVHRSPGRARRTPLKPAAQGRPGDRQHLWSTPCAFLSRTDLGCRRRPAFPAPFGLSESAKRQQASGETSRENEKACLQVAEPVACVECCEPHHGAAKNQIVVAFAQPSHEAGSRPAHSGHIERGFPPTILTCLKPILVRVGMIRISDQSRRNSHATNHCCSAVACSADLSRVRSDVI